MNRMTAIVCIVCVMIVLGFSAADAQERIAEQAYQIFQTHCMTCHGDQGTHKEILRIDRASLIENGTVVPGDPLGSEFYRRLTENTVSKPQMPLGTPPLRAAAIDTVRRWILAGAPEWDVSRDVNFITPEAMLKQLSVHLQTLPEFDRPFARYFTMTHLYNAGESPETLQIYRTALSKLVNSLSWGAEVINPQPIDALETLFYFDLRKYEWDIRDAWRQIETVYPYTVEYAAESDPVLFLYLTSLREGTGSAVPFVHIDWFLATAALPPLYHDILDLPATDRLLEADLDVNAERNLQTAPGVRVWRAGFNDSGVSNHNRVVERHTSRYGAYWKSYDFAGSSGKQNVYTHPLSFQPDGGEVVFHLPNGLQAYLIVDADGQRIDVAPTSIVSNPQASDPAVHNGLSCIGCHTEGMKPFTDTVRAAILSEKNPVYDKAQALRLYVEKTEMDPWIEKDAAQFRDALESTGAVFGGLVEPVSFAHEAFIGPVSAADAAAAVGLETETFLTEIREKSSLQTLGLLALAAEGGNVKRDAWTTNFQQVITALKTEDFIPPPRPTPINPVDTVAIPDPNLRAVIEDALGKAPGDPITPEEMATLDNVGAEDKNISDLTGLEFAKNLIRLDMAGNPLSDISPLASLTKLRAIYINGTEISNLSPLASLHELEELNVGGTRISSLAPLAALKNLQKLGIIHSDISDLSPLSGLTNLTRLLLYRSKATDLSPLRGLTKLRWLGFTVTDTITDFSPLSGLTELRHLELSNTEISDLSALAGLVNLETLILFENRIVDVSPLASLRNLKKLEIQLNNISDFSPLDPIRKSVEVFNWYGNPGFPQGGPKITGPWLWLTLPAEVDEDVLVRDYLAKASNNKVTEEQIATAGASEGTVIRESVWSVRTLEPYKANDGESNLRNLKRLLDAQGAIEFSDREWFVVYGSITLYSPKTQQTKIFMGASHPRRVYLNGKLVHEDHADYSAGEHFHDYQTFVPITLQPGKNVLLIKLGGEWDDDMLSLFFGFEPGTEYEIENPGMDYALSQTPIHVGDTFTLDLSAENVFDLAGWQFDIAFDPAVLEAIEVNEGDFLKEGGGTTFFQKGTIDNTTGKITKLSSARLNEDGATGTGTLLSVTFIAKTGGETQVALENFQLGAITGEAINAGPHEVTFTIEGQLATGDVNRDGQVSVLDLILVARHLGEDASANPQADVNNDGIINIQDLIVVAQHLGESTAAAAPSLIAAIDNGELTSEIIQTWITQAQIEDDGSIAFRQGIATLERLLTLFIPEETALLHNYPNPFNPETWIPYQLADPADVTLTIYSVNGTLVRTLALGYQPAGIYQTRTRAAYWDGKNKVGEPVASGIYFYTLTAGDFTATRKMLIVK